MFSIEVIYILFKFCANGMFEALPYLQTGEHWQSNLSKHPNFQQTMHLRR